MSNKIKHWPGTPLTKEDIDEGMVLSVRGRPRMTYTWDAGVAIGRYLEGLKAGKITGAACDGCGRRMVPPRAFCSTCFRPVDRWIELRDTGTVNTFSLSYVTWDVRKLEEPQIPAVIEIDGTEPSSGILHLIEEVDPKEVKIGMRVQAVWKPPEEREGAITDIRFFKPL